MKILTISKMTQKDIDHLMNEIMIVSHIDHPNLLKIHELFKDSKRFYIVVEMFRGRELFEMIVEKDYFEESKAALIMKQILQVVSYLHSKNIMHRNIKAENILV